MTLPDVYELFAYWRKQPPLHILFAQWVGHKPPAEPTQPSAPDRKQSFREFMQSFGVNVDAEVKGKGNG